MRRLALAAALVAALPATAAAQTTTTRTFYAQADADARAASPALGTGTARLLRVARRPAARAYLRFDLRGLPRGATIQGATLMVGARASRTSRLHARAVNRTWSERTLTWRNAPTVGRVQGRSPRFRGGRVVSLAVTRIVRRGGVVSIAVTAGEGGPVTLSAREYRRLATKLVIRYATGTATPPAPTTPPSPPPPPAPAGAVAVAVGADIACSPYSSAFNDGNGTAAECRQRYTSDLIFGQDYAAVFAPGDLQYEDGELSDFMLSYDKSWGRFKDITYPVPGNHEYEDPAGGAKGYFDYFGARAGDRTKGYYSFDVGAWHVVALNTEKCVQAEGCAAGSAQEQWLRADLAATSRKCVAALMHYPRYASGVQGSYPVVTPLWQALYDAGADLVLAGHDHHYERIRPMRPDGTADELNGMRSFVVGTGGKNLRALEGAQSFTETRQNTAHGILRLILRADGYDWNFMTAAGSPVFTDTGSASCH